MKFLFFLLLISAVYAQFYDCQFSVYDISANWTSTANGIDVRFTKESLGKNKTTGIVLAASKKKISFLRFVNINSQVIVQTGYLTKGTLVADLKSPATVQYANLTGWHLDALVTLPFKFDGVDMKKCQEWAFVEDGLYPATLPNVCPSKCT